MPARPTGSIGIGSSIAAARSGPDDVPQQFEPGRASRSLISEAEGASGRAVVQGTQRLGAGSGGIAHPLDPYSRGDHEGEGGDDSVMLSWREGHLSRAPPI